MKEFLEPMKLSQYRIARDIHVPPRRINDIVRGFRAITADTALRLGRYFKMDPQFWLNLQAHYDLERERDRDRIGAQVEKEVPVLAKAS